MIFTEMKADVAGRAKPLTVYMAQRGELLRYAAKITGDRAEAEDVVQEAWLRFGKVAAERPLDGPAGYLIRIVRNLALDGRRRRAAEQRRLVDDGEERTARIVSEEPCAERRLASQDELAIVRRTLDGLPDRVRIAVEMHRLEGARLKEIAARLDVSTTVAHELVAQGIDACRHRLRRFR